MFNVLEEHQKGKVVPPPLKTEPWLKNTYTMQFTKEMILTGVPYELGREFEATLLRAQSKMLFRLANICGKVEFVTSCKYVEHKADHDKRHSMSSNWASLVCMNLEAFTIGDAILLSGKGVSHRLVVESVSACMARKATSTITKRFYALNRFVGYCGKSGLQCFPILE